MRKKNGGSGGEGGKTNLLAVLIDEARICSNLDDFKCFICKKLLLQTILTGSHSTANTPRRLFWMINSYLY
jgi:hypothetical protein